VPRTCLYCVSAEGPFEGREHIFPEGLGNTTLILPEGVVCRRCNNGPLARWDAELQAFAPIALSRITKGIPTKRGSLPNANFANMRVRSITPGEIAFEHHDSKSFEKTGPTSFRMSITGRRMTMKYVSNLTRALFKIVLGLIYLDHGPTALDARFDRIRSVVQGDPFRGYLLIKNEAVPRDDVRVTYQFMRFPGQSQDTVWIEADFFGIQMYTDTDYGVMEYPKTFFGKSVTGMEF
jgi:hypothetical protein